ncbi:MAG: AAA family ATPase [Desulfobaccales bacterium]
MPELIKPDIIQVAQALNCLPEHKSGSRLYGSNCPAKHGSENGRCFNIWPDTQSFHCFHCGAGSDVFDLIKTALNCDFKDALYWAREHGLITGNGYNEASYTEHRKIHQILTEATKFFHASLTDPIREHLQRHYGLTIETIGQYQIGYAPTDQKLMKKHLTAKGYNLADIKKTGLLGKYGDSFFQGQIIFPYYHQGLVKYFIGRKTEHTPSFKKGKYEKLPVTEFVKNEFFFGEDSVRKAQEVYVNEGVTDCLAALQHGLSSISPVTTLFKKTDQPKLLFLVRGKKVFLVPDNEENQAGMTGAQETLQFLKTNGVEACIITLPRPEGTEKMDFNEFVRDHGIEAFLGLVKDQGPLSINDLIYEVSDFLKLDLKPKRSILHPWVSEYSIIMIYGPRGVGKTMLVIGLLDSITSGAPFGPWEMLTPCRCLYLDGEMPPQDTADRFKFLANGHRKEKLFIYSDAYANSLGIPGADLLNEEWRQAMKDILQKKRIRLWAVDNIASLAPGMDENSKQEWDPINKWFLDLRAAGITTVFLHHANKSGGQRGTSGREDNIDISVLLERPQNYTPEQGARFVAKFEKARIKHSDLHLIGDTEFSIETAEDGSYVWTFASVKKQTKVEVLRMLDEGMAAKDIASSLKITEARVSQIRGKALKDGLITETGKLTQSGFQWLQKT